MAKFCSVQPVLLTVLLLAILSDRTEATFGLFGPQRCNSNRDCPPINRQGWPSDCFLKIPISDSPIFDTFRGNLQKM